MSPGSSACRPASANQARGTALSPAPYNAGNSPRRAGVSSQRRVKSSMATRSRLPSMASCHSTRPVAMAVRPSTGSGGTGSSLIPIAFRIENPATMDSRFRGNDGIWLQSNLLTTEQGLAWRTTNGISRVKVFPGLPCGNRRRDSAVLRASPGCVSEKCRTAFSRHPDSAPPTHRQRCTRIPPRSPPAVHLETMVVDPLRIDGGQRDAVAQ